MALVEIVVVETVQVGDPLYFSYNWYDIYHINKIKFETSPKTVLEITFISNWIMYELISSLNFLSVLIKIDPTKWTWFSH